MTIKITAYSADIESHRLERLKEVSAAVEKATHFSKVIALHDHKGCLYANFDQRPTTSDIVVVVDAWRQQNEYQVNVYVRNEPLIWDVLGENPFDGRET